MENKIHVWNILKPATSHRNDTSIEDLYLLPRFPSQDNLSPTSYAFEELLPRPECDLIYLRVFRWFTSLESLGFDRILVDGDFRPSPLKNDGLKVRWDDEIPNWLEQENSCSKPPISDYDMIPLPVHVRLRMESGSELGVFHIPNMFKIAFGCQLEHTVEVPSPLSHR